MNAVQLAIFDWAGTTVDCGSGAPVSAFKEAFARRGVAVSDADARGPMGLHKKDHIRAMLQLPAVAEAWRSRHDRAWTEDDVVALFESFMPLQLEVLDRHSDVISGVVEAVANLRNRKIKIGGTTGYFRAAADRVAAAAANQGYRPDVSLCPDDVASGRPAPWMIFRIMEAVGVYPPCRVVKIGDTVPDIEEGRNAGVWSVGIVRTGSEVGMTEAELSSARPEKLAAMMAAARRKLEAAGAHDVIDSVADAPDLIDRINDRLRRGERP